MLEFRMQNESFLVSYKNREGEEDSGPLELLWRLIHSYEVDIFDVSLTRITTDFLAYMKEHNIAIEEESDFALMATRLVYYKSKLLLPNPPPEEEVMDYLPLELVEQLLEYKRYQITSEYFRELESSQIKSATRLPSWNEYEHEIEFLQVDFMSFLKAYQVFLETKEKEKPMSIAGEEVDLEQISSLLRETLKQSPEISFFHFVQDFSLLKLVTSFFAMLELTRLREIDIFQNHLFSDILIKAREVHV